ncbi:MAG: hypothetical protein R2715_11810 [Ilumatobacteraceae bacterium]
MADPAILSHHHGFDPVVVASGHMTDTSGRASARFPESAVADVERSIDQQFSDWGVGEGALVICGGARGADLLAARVARRRGATVWVLLARAAPRFLEGSVAGAAPGWADEFWALLARTPSWVLDPAEAEQDPSDVYSIANAWMLDVARAQAGPAPVRLLAIWDGAPAPAPGGTAEMARRAQDAGAVLEIIPPSP